MLLEKSKNICVIFVTSLKELTGISEVQSTLCILDIHIKEHLILQVYLHYGRIAVRSYACTSVCFSCMNLRVMTFGAVGKQHRINPDRLGIAKCSQKCWC